MRCKLDYSSIYCQLTRTKALSVFTTTSLAHPSLLLLSDKNRVIIKIFNAKVTISVLGYVICMCGCTLNQNGDCRALAENRDERILKGSENLIYFHCFGAFLRLVYFISLRFITGPRPLSHRNSNLFSLPTDTLWDRSEQDTGRNCGRPVSKDETRLSCEFSNICTISSEHSFEIQAKKLFSY